MNAAVVLVCGIPGCGKSTLVHAIANAFYSNKSEIYVDRIEYDEVYHEIRISNACDLDASVSTETETSKQFVVDEEDGDADDIHSPETRIAWQKSRCVALQRVKDWLSNLRPNNDTIRVLLLDDNFYLKSMRKQIYRVCANFLQEYGVSFPLNLYFGIIYVHAPLSECLQRNAQRPNPVAEETIERMMERFEVPTVQNPWEAAILSTESTKTFDSLPDQVEQVQQFLTSITENTAALVVPRTEEEEALPDPYTIRQEADLFWRRCVGWVAQQARTKVPLANRVRKHCLQQPLSSQDSAPSQWLSRFLHGLPSEASSDWLTEEEQRQMQQDLLSAE